MRRLLRRIVIAVRDEFRAVRELPWATFPAMFESLPIYVFIMFILFVGMTSVLILLLPAFFVSNDPTHLLGYLVAAQVLVHLAWIVLGWFGAVTVGVVVMSVLARRSPALAVPEFGRSIARIASWTGRLAMPVLLGSIAFWVLGIGGHAPGSAGQASIIRQIAVLQLGMLLLSLTIVVAVESVHVVFRAAAALPWSVRIAGSVVFPLVGWAVGRRVAHLRSTAELVFGSIAPPTVQGIPRSALVPVVGDSVVATPFVVGVLAVALVTVAFVVGAVVRRSTGPGAGDGPGSGSAPARSGPGGAPAGPVRGDDRPRAVPGIELGEDRGHV